MAEKFKVVISGMSGRFPESNDVHTFKEKLYNGDDMVTVDNRKWPVGYNYNLLGRKMIPDATGKVSNVHKLDYTVFKINTIFALSYDIINRLAPEPAFEAIVDAGINPYSLDGHNIGVFMSTGPSDVECNMVSPNLDNNILAVIGCNKTMLSNRISFAMNLTGPSFTNHVDLHGGLESLSLGYKYVSEGFVEAAIVGVASSILDPRISMQYFPLGILCSDGVTRPFDEWASGCARSEGVICFYLQRAEEAKRNYGEIKFCDIHFKGSILPNHIGYDEEYVTSTLESLYELNNISPDSLDLGYVEMNAYGYKPMDKIESNAVAEVLTKSRNSPLLVGSIKSNIGHTEACAGLMGVVKALFTLQSGCVAPNLHLTKENDDIRAIKQKRLQVVTEQTPLSGNTIAVNSIGLFGSVGTAVIQRSDEKLVERSPPNEEFPRILLICGRVENTLANKLAHIEKLPYNPNFIALTNDSLGQHMPHHIWRGFTLLPPPFQPVHEIQTRGEQNRPVWFIFSGMGSQWNTMGKSLLSLPLFAETVAKCDKVLREKNIDIYNILTSEDPTLFDNIINAFVGIITVQIGLYEIIKALGIEPDGIIGHSVGENGCAYADGCLSLEQAVLASWARGVASTEVETVKGMMAAVGKGYADIKDTLPEDIQVACHNSADSCTLTGPAESVNNFVEKLQTEGVFAKAVNVANIAYHSKYIASAGPKLLERLKQVIKEPKKRSSKWVSTSVPESEWDTPLAHYCSAEYLTNNLLSPVLFEEGSKHIPTNAICIEFAPHGLLQAILKRSLPDTCTNVPLTSRMKPQENLNFLLAAIGRLYIAGLEPQVNNIFPRVEYPVPRDTPSISPYCTWYHSDDPIPYHLIAHDESYVSDTRIPISIKEDSNYAYLKDHKINGDAIVPTSFFMYLAWWILSFKRTEKIGSSAVIFEDVILHKQVTIRDQETKYVSVMVQFGSGYFEIILRDEELSTNFEVIVTGRINATSEKMKIEPEKRSEESGSKITKLQFYDTLEHGGYRLGEEFKLVNDLHRHNNMEYETSVTWNENWVAFLDALMKVQMFGDNNEKIDNIFPSRVRRLEIDAPRILLLEKGSKLLCQTDVTTKQLLCTGISMCALRYKSFSKPETRLNRFRFVSYENPRCQNIHEFLNVCLQIAIENLTTFGSHVNKLSVVDTTNKYSEVLKIIVADRSLNASVAIRSAEKLFTSSNECILIIAEDAEMGNMVSLKQTANLLILTISPHKMNGDVRCKERFVEIIKQSFPGKIKASLLRLKCNFNQKPFVFVDNHNGVSKNKIREVVDESTPHFVVCKNIDFADVTNLLATKKEHSNTRYLYILDEVTNNQQLEEQIKKQIELNLSVSILKHGEWGSYRNLAIKAVEKYGNNEVTDIPLLSSLSKESLGMDYICLYEDQNIEISSQEKMHSFSYAAFTNRKEKIIGLAMTTSCQKSPQRDPLLCWSVPNTWSMKEAVVVPYIYAQAYRLLFTTNRLVMLKSVLVNMGKEYLLAEALIVLSLHKNLDVFVTVSTDEEASLIKNRFPKIPLNRIFHSQSCSYEPGIKQISKNGVDLVINCLSGTQHVEASLRCLATAGLYKEIGINNCLESCNIGLYTFLNLISFYIIRNRVSDLLELPTQTKETMKKSIDECIKTGVIVPPKLDTQSINPASMKIIKCSSGKEIENCNPRTIIYDCKHSYLIVGTGIKDNSWFELVEWLIAQGARKFTIALEKCALLSRTEHRINQLLAQRNVKILLTSASKLDSKQEAVSLLKETEGLAPLEAVFFVSTKGHPRKISVLNGVVSPEVHFIGLSSTGLKEFEHRRSRGSPAILIHCDKSDNILNILPYLNELLIQNDNNNAEVLYQITNTIYDGIENMKVTRPSLRDYLPQNIETLNGIGREEIKELEFVEICSLSRRYSSSKGIKPVFALPAIHSIMLQPLFKQLLYPVFSATTTPTNSTKQTAQKLYQSLSKIQPSGPVNIISETWTLPLALELVSYAQVNDRKYRIFVLEGNPENWSDQVKHLLPSSSEKCNSLCADEIFHFDTKIKEKSRPNGSISFENKVEFYAQNASRDVRTTQNVVRAAKMIRDKIAELAQMQFPNQLLKNVTWFERYRPTNRTFNLSVTSEIIVLNDMTYKSVLANPEVSKIINENAEFSWW